MPTVSVFIATYNHARYLSQTLDSVLAQTYQDFEIVIINDGSTDNSHELLTEYQGRYPDKIRYSWHPNHVNKGVTYTSNAAIELCRGELLAWLGSDDIWMPEKLARQVAVMRDRPDIGMICTRARIIDQDGKPRPGIMGKQLPERALQQLVLGMDICASTTLIRRSCLDDVGLFDESLVYSDWELFIRIAAKYPIGCIAEPLAMYRIHGRNMSISSRPEIKLERNLAVLAVVFSSQPGLPPTLRDQAAARVYLSTALDYFATGQREMARHHMAQAAQLSNTSLVVEPEALIELVVAYAQYWLPVAQEDSEARIRFLHEVFSVIAPHLERAAVSKFHVIEAFDSHARHNRPGTRRHLLHAVALQPAVLRNSGVLSVGAQACLGSTASGWLRKLVRSNGK
ncbi:MAG: glycosyltransferase [Chloroflexi bacterium]|nr:glycosyltransferase [Chloroflexota bacterium]